MLEDDLSINSINFDDYDFLDFGCSAGKSIIFGQNKFGGKRGIGIDIDLEKVKQARHYLSAEGLDEHTVICEDINNLPDYNLSSRKRFTTCIHFLEHVNGISMAENIIKSAIALSEEFVFISQPFCDKDSELFGMGFKTYYSDWSDHINLMTSYDFYKICRNLKYEGLISDFIIFGTERITSSNSSYIHPLTSLSNQHDYDSNIHPQKKEDVEFRGLFKDVNVFLILDENFYVEDAMTVINKDFGIIYDSCDNAGHKEELSLDDCDFVDIGFGNGNSLNFGIQKFGGSAALGIEKDPKRIDQVMLKMGDFKHGFSYHKLLCEDVFNIDTKSSEYYGKFRFATCINMVEELGGVDELRKLISLASDMCTDFLFISHVNNDYDDYLSEYGLRTSTRVKSYNKLFLTSDDYNTFLGELKDNGLIADYIILKRKLILDSSSPNIFALEGDSKNFVEFDELYINMDVFVFFDEDVDSIPLLKHLSGEKKVLYSTK